MAMNRLRHRLALDLRRAVDLENRDEPAWWAALLDDGGRLRVSPRHPAFFEMTGRLLDVLTATDGSVSRAADHLRLTTANLVTAIQGDDKLLASVNTLRVARGLKTLGSR